MKILSASLVVSTTLFFVGVFLFSQIKSCHYFTPTAAASHIVDTHLMPDGTDTSLQQYGRRFFDAAYVKEAAKAYAPSRYVSSFFILDFFFPFVYGFFLLSLAASWKQRPFYRVLKAGVVLCVLFDLSENFGFAYYLFHRQQNAYHFVAFCTTLKSLLFVSCFSASLLAFIIAVFKRLRK